MQIAISILALVLLGWPAKAQFKMNSAGHIGLGGRTPSSSYWLTVESQSVTSLTCTKLGLNATPSSSYLLELGGVGRIKSTYNNHIILDFSGGYYSASIYPYNNNTCNLGLSNKAFKYVYAYNYPSVSDFRQKENIREIKKALDLVLDMHGIMYDIKKEYAYTDDMLVNAEVEEKLEKERKNYYGFLAQELAEVAPELTNHDDSADVYTVNYMQVIPILVEAIKEQQAMILQLEEKVQDKEEKSAATAEAAKQFMDNSLQQNQPNPFSESTLINYSLSEKVETATICVYDMNGTQLMSIPLNLRGESSIEINGGILKAGMYMYTLIADNTVIDTKTMILTD